LQVTSRQLAGIIGARCSGAGANRSRRFAPSPQFAEALAKDPSVAEGFKSVIAFEIKGSSNWVADLRTPPGRIKRVRHLHAARRLAPGPGRGGATRVAKH